MIYFVIFKAQSGQLEPAYSYVTGAELEELRQQDVIATSYSVQDPQYNKDEVDFYFQKYHQEQGGTLV